MKRTMIFAACLLAVATTICDAASYTLTISATCNRNKNSYSGTPSCTLNELPLSPGNFNGSCQPQKTPYFSASYDSFTGILNVSMAAANNEIGADNAVYQGPPNNLRLIRGDANTTWPATLQLTP